MALWNRGRISAILFVIGVLGLAINANAQVIDEAALEAKCFDARLKPQTNQLACARLQAVLLKQLLEKKLDVTVQAPAVTVAAPDVQVPPAEVTVNFPEKQNAIFIRRDFVNCNKPNTSTCERVARRLCRTIGFGQHYIVYDERDYARANGLICYDELKAK